MGKIVINLDDTAYIARSLVSNNYTWDHIKCTIRNVYSYCNGDIDRVVEQVMKDRNLKRVFKDYLLIQLAREHSTYINEDEKEG